MTTFKMAQAAYENPGKVFVRKDDKLTVTWSDCSRTLIYPHSGHTVDLHYCQRMGYVWEEERTPRKWSGEYVCNSVGAVDIPKGTGTPVQLCPNGVRKFRVKWEAEEVL